jgi:tRNA A-37 threonylcarbamoyl transferase component Bud32
LTSGTGTHGAWMPSAGDVLAGKYRVERVLGEGGMGIVFAAHHELLEQRVAIKLLLPEITRSTEAVARFLNEARASSRIQNEHVARVLDVGRLESGAPFMVIEFLEGLDLAQVLEQRGRLPATDVVDWLLQALEAIAQAHALGIVHRDLKPSNLFLARRQDGTSHIKVLDFGISKALDPPTGGAGSRGAVTSTNAVLGSPAYMSPEQLRDSKSVDARTDIWSLGVLAYELLTADIPFHGDSVVALYAAIQERAPRPVREKRPDVPVVLDEAILKCLRVNPRDRFPTVTDLALAITPHGTRAAALSCERIQRILPRAAGEALLPTRVSSPDAPLVAGDAAGLAKTGRVATEAPWATPRSPAVRRARTQRLALVVLAGVLTAAGLAAGVLALRTRQTPAHVTASSSAEPPPAMPPENAPETATTQPSAALPPVATLPPLPSASSAPTTVAPATAAAIPSTRPASTAAKTWQTAPAPATKPKPNCNPPTYVDSAGHTQFKVECLK